MEERQDLLRRLPPEVTEHGAVAPLRPEEVPAGTGPRTGLEYFHAAAEAEPE